MAFIISLIITVLLDILILYLGLLVFKKNPQGKINQIFFILAFAILSWIVFNFLENEISYLPLAAFFLKLDFSTGPLIVSFFLLFAVYFPDRAEILAIWKKILLAAVCALFAILPFSNLLLNNFTIKNRGIRYEEGSLYEAYAIFLLGMIMWGSYILIKKYLSYTGQKRLQVIYVLVSFGLTGLITAVINLFFSNSLPIEVSRIGIYCFIIFIGSTTYAMVRHHLMDIRVIIQKSLVFTFLLVIISVLYALIVFSVNFIAKGLSLNWLIFSAALTVIILSFTLPVLEKKFTKLTDKIFFKAPIDYKEALKTLSYIFATEIKLPELVKKTRQFLQKTFKIDLVSFYFSASIKKYYRISSADKNKIYFLPAKGSYLAKYFTSQSSVSKIIARDDLEWQAAADKTKIARKMILEMDALKGDLVIAIFGQKELLGIICLGHKLDDNPYFSQDIEWFDIIAKQLGLALETSLLYENLEDLVAERTEQLKQANQKLKQISAAKSEFVSVASHQLKTPLSVIRNIFSLLKDGDLGKVTAKQSDYGQRGFKQSEKLIKLVKMLLNISRIETGRLNLELSKSNLDPIIKEHLPMFETLAKQKKIQIQFSPGLDNRLFNFDKNLIGEVIDNLLDNAIKYTPQGKIIIKSQKIGKLARVSISDTGLGIKPDNLKELFQRFIRGSDKKKIAIAGTGLGLYFCRRVIEVHNGKIWAESPGLDKGAVFIFELPMIK
ncbi:MAG: ATP-binding protein [Patescibacteria group bacterium]